MHKLTRCGRQLLRAKAQGTLTSTTLVFVSVLLMVSGAIHLNLWVTTYRHVPTLGPLFIVQGVSAILIGVGLATFRRAVPALMGLFLVVGTILGFTLVLTIGLFNFKLRFISNEQAVVLGVESAALVALVFSLVRMANSR